MTEQKKDEMVHEVSSSEKFLVKNQKTIMTVLVAIIAVIALVLAVKQFYFEPREAKAQEALFQSVLAFEQDSLDLALNGNDEFDGLIAVIDNYGSTKAGNIANVYAGLAYYGKGEYENAKSYLSKFSANDVLLAPAVTAAIGNALVNMDNAAEAVKYFEKAAKVADNALFSPIYLIKAANVYEKLGNKADALRIYEQIKKEYPTSQQASTIDSYIERVK
ncbi:MAG: tetratricopeptide repeat protein [Bacteroidaceae bacterium]|nr:tetratricopeptide repeat protein [Bacteroidaceae bacterium]MBR4069696.1 tetratricopeptide repeat protein [Bacteroidaceae bacterium]